MTTPDIPAHTSQRWSKRGCTAPGCTSQDTATVDGIRGRRCQAHAPRFDPATAVAVALTDPKAAGWYCAAFGDEDGAA